MPKEPIDSIVVYNASSYNPIVTAGTLRARVSVPLLNLFLGFNREVYWEIKEVFYSTTSFTINVTRGGATLCE